MFRKSLKQGFTLAEVIIVSVVLTLLLASVWGLFRMQHQTLERGQRLSRETRVSLALQRLLHDDLSRVTERVSSPQSSLPSLPVAANSAESANELDAWLAQRLPAADTETMVNVQFQLVGARDSLIVDVLRPAYQMGAFVETTNVESDSVGLPAARSTNNLVQSPNEMPERLPTAFERVIYLWLTDEELVEVTGLLFGQESNAGQADGPSPNEALSPDSARPTAIGRNDTDLTFSTAGSAVPQTRRTLLRIRTDWSWPREGEQAGMTWASAVEADSSSSLDFGSGLGGDPGSSSPQRRQWLRSLLWSARPAYREFHLQSESAIQLDGSSTNDSESPLIEAESLLAGESNATTIEEHLLPNRWVPQVDWFPEVVAGKFEYFNGSTWRDSFNEQRDVKIPPAIRLQYQIDARRYPVQVNSSLQLNPDQSGGTSGPSFNASESLTGQSNFADPLSAIAISSRPEFPHVVAFTFQNLATRRDMTDEFGADADSTEDLESVNDPFREFDPDDQLSDSANVNLDPAFGTGGRRSGGR